MCTCRSARGSTSLPKKSNGRFLAWAASLYFFTFAFGVPPSVLPRRKYGVQELNHTPVGLEVFWVLFGRDERTGGRC